MTLKNVIKDMTPTYKLTLPYSKKIVTYRPFLVKEERNLLLAIESKDQEQILQSIISTINACVKTNKFNVESLPIFELEYLFLNIRAKSVGEVIDVKVIDPETEKEYVSSINIEDVSIPKVEIDHEIKVNDDLMIELDFPRFGEVMKTLISFPQDQTESVAQIDASMDMVASCIKEIHHGDKTYKTADVTHEELKEFVTTLPRDILDKISDYYKNLPTVTKDVEYTTEEGEEKSIELKGINSFL